MPAPTHGDIDRASRQLAEMSLFPTCDAGVHELSDGPCAGLAVELPRFGDDALPLRQARCRILIEDALPRTRQP